MIPLHTRAALTTLYSESGRHYHGLTHVYSLLRALAASETAKKLTPHVRAIEYSIWFHDAVYDVRQADAENVRQSAELAVDAIMRDGVSHVDPDEVYEMIMRTANHFGPFTKELTEAEKLFLDLDLSILGADENTYFYDYALKIREEYRWVPQDTFARKRCEILGNILNQRSIFYTDEFQKLEDQARKNITSECTNLRLFF